jgi:Putative adhesin
MRSKIPVGCAAIALLISANAFAANVTITERFVKELQLDSADSVWIDNPVGNIEVVGSESPGLFATVMKTTTGVDQAALKEGSDQTVVSFEGDRNVRLIRTILPRTHGDKWTSTVSYTLRVPRTVQVKIASRIGGRIRVANILGAVTVTTFAGVVILDGVVGASLVETTNGKVFYIYRQKPTAPAQVQAVNADIDVVVPPDSTFNWIADTLRGDILTNLPARAQFLGNAFRGSVNGTGGPTITLQTLLGNIRVLGNGIDVSLAQNVRLTMAHSADSTEPLLMRPAKRVQLPISAGPFDFSASYADVEVGEVRGWAHVETAAGEIKLGMVYGDCAVSTKGGPLDLGEITGTLTASTDAGDVLIRTARQGGHVFTAGGIIRVLYSGGPIVLQSGGGDISVRQAAGPVNAETRSGDINITADSQQRTQKLQAHTQQGNISITVSPRFAADIDATVLTSRPDANAIRSDFNGLTIKREQVGGKTRIHATGKLNGGGERVELFAEEGDIRISNSTASPVMMGPP